MNAHPNVLLVVSDQHRAQALRCAGDENVKTPNFNRMAAEGARFPRCVSNAPVCGPFRASLQTGLYYYQHGERNNAIPVDRRCPALADHFNRAGYRTCYIGKAHWDGTDKPGFVAPGRRMRWGHWRGHNRGHFHFDWPVFDSEGNRTHRYAGRYEPEAQTDYALEWIESNRDHPWIVQLNWGPPHTETQSGWSTRPEVRRRMVELNHELEINLSDDELTNPDRNGFENYFPQHLIGQHIPQRYLDMYDPAQFVLDPNVPEGRQMVTRYHLLDYYALISSIDEQLGRLLDYLTESGLSENTRVLYTSDHGDYVGSRPGPAGRPARGKSSPYQNVYRTPLLLWGAGIRRGARPEALTTTVDLLPTILELAGLPVDAALPGVSRAGWATDGEGPPRRDALLTLGTWRALYDGRFCYAVNGRDGELEPLHLIDTANDPYDLHDLSDDAAHGETARRLHARLVQRLIMAGDPDAPPG